MKKSTMIAMLITTVLITCIGITPKAASAEDYKYNIKSCGTDECYRTPQQLKFSGIYYADNYLYTNTSTKKLLFYVAETDGWKKASESVWQMSGTGKLLSYYSSYENYYGYVKLCFRRDTLDTYSGTRYVWGSWTANK